MTDLSPAAWNDRYQAGDTPWDLSGPTPEFVRLLDAGLLPKKGRVLVPGGGRGHDAVLLASRGYDVDLIDFAPRALEAALIEASKARVSAQIHAYRRDFFDLATVGYHQQSYDLLLEYTFFCAIDPALRPRYVDAAAALLRPGGMLAGLFFPTSIDKPGPPFAVSREEVETLFRTKFELQIETPQASVKPRAGREFLGLFRKK